MNEIPLATTEYYDVAIIGCGPSGCACALALRDSGLRVVLVDKAVFPRDKICGDAIPGPAFKVMDKIDPQLGEQMRAFASEERIHSSRGVAPNGQQATMHWKTFSYNSKRLDFDHFLLELVRKQTDTIVREGQQLTSIERTTEGLVGHFRTGMSIRTALMIGCDGANSVVARELANYDLKANARSSAVRTYYRGVANVEAGINEFHFFKELPLGYFWIFPVENGSVNVGLGLLTKRGKSEKGYPNPRKLLEGLIEEHPRLKERFSKAEAEDKIRGFALPFCDTRRSLVGDNYMLCGDAASLVSPLWGHGIDTGMLSGYYAARQAIESHQIQCFSSTTLKAYDRVVYEKIVRSFLRNQWLLRLVGRFPWLLRVVYASFYLFVDKDQSDRLLT